MRCGELVSGRISFYSHVSDRIAIEMILLIYAVGGVQAFKLFGYFRL